MSGKLFRLWPAVVVAATLLWVGGVAGQQGAPTTGEWRRIGGDGGNTRYSPLDQINAANVKNLKIAWTWKGDNFGGVFSFLISSPPPKLSPFQVHAILRSLTFRALI